MLNDAQKTAVFHQKGPLLVLAGAGAGKTRVITHRIQHLIENGVDPQNILAVTFTNKAAKEMRERVQKLLSEDGEADIPYRDKALPFVSTFHALGVHILRSHGKILGLTRSFTIFDRSDSLSAIKMAMEQVSINPKEFEPRKILGSISKAKGDAVGLRDYEEGSSDFYPRLVARVWHAYARLLEKEKALDFDDLLFRTLELLRTNTSVRRFYQEQWVYVHIDEYQDTN